ncbi:hypothetical protein [Actinotalea solisilvae]|uniref:hypothetical protein n=1 Tax=Actinotalea solisilvae TaxID=2072922 RepID=UPI0018F1AC07|nr:hypothetical protein [Actinotalea solisilvae]
MTANPLVAGPVDTSSALGGTMLVESLYDLSRAIESEDWVAAGLAGLSTVLDTAAAVMDPLGQLIAAGLGWLMEHVEPLKGWLNDLTGDAGAVLGFAGTWDNIATQMGSAAGDLDHLVAADLEGMRGQGVEAYARYASDFAEHLRGIGGSSTAVASSLRTCSTIVQVVHDLVRDAIAELVGAAISWAAQIVFTVGLGTPWVVSQVATRVSSLAARVGSKVTGVITSARALGDLIDALKAAIRSLGDNLRGARPGTTHTPSAPATPPPPSTHGVAFFGPSNLTYYTRSNATLGTSSSPYFHMPIEDSALVRTPSDALRYTGNTPSIEREILNPSGPNGPEIYGLSFPLEGLGSVPPTRADANGWPHYMDGGHTAVRLEDAPGRPGTGGYLVNPTREFVVHGGPAVPPGSVLFQLMPDGSWQPLRRY